MRGLFLSEKGFTNKKTSQKLLSGGVLKAGVLRSFEKFTGKHLCQGLYLKKSDSGTGVFQ